MSFQRIGPQIARHSDGYIVRLAGRYRIEYSDGAQIAIIEADLEGPLVGLYPKTVEWTHPEPRLPTEDERSMVLERIRKGMYALGDACEMIDP